MASVIMEAQIKFQQIMTKHHATKWLNIIYTFFKDWKSYGAGETSVLPVDI